MGIKNRLETSVRQSVSKEGNVKTSVTELSPETFLHRSTKRGKMEIFHIERETLYKKGGSSYGFCQKIDP